MMLNDASPVLLTQVQLFDGTQPHAETSVLLRDGLIAQIGTEINAPAGTQQLNCSGMTLLPGLIDAHTHVFPGRLEQALVLGVTTELDMFGDPKAVTELKQQAGQRAEMADLRSAGTGATVTGGHPCQLVAIGAYPPFPTLAGPEEAEQFVAARCTEGSDYLKVLIEPGWVLGTKLPTLDADTVAALVAAAHRRRMLVVAHATDHVSAQLALDAGVDGLAHVFIDQLPPPGFIDTAVARGVFVVPTLVVLENICGQSAAKELLNDSRIAPYLDAMSRTMLQIDTWPTPLGAAPDFSVALTMVAQLHQAGVPILAGTDATAGGTAHGASIHRELELLVRAGLSPSQALSAATSAPADRFGLTDRGRIAPGLAADLLLVAGDPTVDITATRNIVGVWRGGVRLDRDAAIARQPSEVPTVLHDLANR